MIRSARAGAVAGGWALIVSVCLPAAQTPLQIIKESNQKVMAIVTGPGRAAGNLDARVGAALDEVTSFPRISAAILEGYRGRLSAAQFEEMSGVLREVLKAALVRKLKKLEVDRLMYVVESVHGSSALVRTAAYFEGEKYDLDYLLELVGGRWIIVNYVLDGVDAVENYRRQLAELFAKEPYDSVLARLRKKLSAGPPAS